MMPIPPSFRPLLRLAACGVWLTALLFSGCGSDECIQNVRLRETNTHSDPCEARCDCNNLTHEGYCVEGRCVSKKRESAQTKGAVRHCLLFQPRGTCLWGLQTAQPEPLTSLLWGDCDPYGIEPENTEATCTDGKDNNCDGRVDLTDPGCSAFCIPGQVRGCFTGDRSKLSQGSCRPGRQTCLSPSSWGPCKDEVLPTAEVCNGLDDDCNGSIDDGLPGCTPKPCKDGSQRPCYTDLQGCEILGQDPERTVRCQGSCRSGRQTCAQGVWGICEGQTSAQQERCDGLDNNCDGHVDEGCLCEDGTTQACSLGASIAFFGTCAAGLQTCVGSHWQACLASHKPTPEICDGLDNDCDGQIDNDLLPPPCSQSKQAPSSVCKGALQTCQGAAGWKDCTPDDLRRHNARFLADEAGSPCDGLDNDCDGQIDEGCEGCFGQPSRPCYPGPPKTENKGSCKAGYQLCLGSRWSSCLDAVLPASERCDGLDNDCDGQIDNPPAKASLCQNGFVCLSGRCQPPPRPCPIPLRSCYTGPPQTAGIGRCQAGSQICTLDSQDRHIWGPCLDPVIPTPEVCNGKDDDCDGSVDENDPAQPPLCASGLCQQGRCVSSSGDGGDPDSPTSSRCWQPCYDLTPEEPPTPTVLRFCSGLVFCSLKNGQIQEECRGSRLPQEERCDGKDNDCDGSIDNLATGRPPLCNPGFQCLQGRCLSTERPPETTPERPPEASPDGGTSCLAGQSRPCYNASPETLGKGLCREGIERCQNGSWSACLGENLPTTEVCDGKDNDCNGSIDDLDPASAPLCSRQSGVCRGSRAKCQGSHGWEADCSPQTLLAHSPFYQTQETLCDGLDNDCNGQLDDSCPWAGSFHSTATSLTHDITNFTLAPSSGKLWLSGSLQTSLRFDPTPASLHNPLQAFSLHRAFNPVQTDPPQPLLLHLDSQAKLLCSAQAATQNKNSTQAFHRLLAGNTDLYAAGYFSQRLSFPPLAVDPLTSEDIFLAKFDPSCQPLWLTRLSGAPTASPLSFKSPHSMALSSSQTALCLTGYAENKPLQFGLPPSALGFLPSSPSDGRFLACLSTSDGRFSSIYDLGRRSSASHPALVAFSGDQILHLVSSVCSSPLTFASLPPIAQGTSFYLTRFSFDPTAKTARPLSILQTGHSSSSCTSFAPRALLTTPLQAGKGRIYLLGDFTGQITERAASPLALGGTSLQAETSRDIALLAWEFDEAPTSPSYRFLWSRRLTSYDFSGHSNPSSEPTDSHSLALDPQGNLYLAGRFLGLLHFPAPGPGPLQTSCRSSLDQSVPCSALRATTKELFLLKLSPDGSFLWGLSSHGNTSDEWASLHFSSSSFRILGLFQTTFSSGTSFPPPFPETLFGHHRFPIGRSARLFQLQP